MAMGEEQLSQIINGLVDRLRGMTSEVADLVVPLSDSAGPERDAAMLELRRVRDVISDLDFYTARLEPQRADAPEDYPWRPTTSRPRRYEESPLFTESILWMNTSGAVDALRMVQNVEKALDVFGVRFMMIEEVQGGSFMTRWNALFKSERSREKADEIAEMVADVATAYGRAKLGDATAEVDLKVSQAVANIAEAAGDADFVWLGGGFVVARHTDENGRKVMQGETLNATQQRLLSENPGALRSPENVMRDLGYLQEQNRLDGGEVFRELPPGQT